MRSLLAILTFISFAAFGQKDSLKSDVPQFDTIKIPAKWPYVNGRTPPLIGVIVGYNFYSNPYIEIGTVVNISDNDGLNGGLMLGPTLSYKKYLQKNINSVNLDLGIYTFLAFGLGMNYTFTNKEGFVGFKPFIGISCFHFQATYGYNFFSEKNNRDMQLGHHHINLRLAIPICQILQKYQ